MVLQRETAIRAGDSLEPKCRNKRLVSAIVLAVLVPCALSPNPEQGLQVR